MTKKIKINLILSLIILSHLIFLNLYSVNFEFHFLDKNNFLFKDFFLFADDYFAFQANTIVYPIIIASLKFIFPFLDTLIIGRLLSIFGVLLFYISIIKLIDLYKLQFNLEIIVLTLMNPIIWVMSHRATPDFFSMSLAIFAIANIISAKKFYQYLYLSMILGLSISIKPIVGIFLILFNLNIFFNFFYNKLLDYPKLILVNIFSLVIPLFYFYYINYNFNFFISDEYHMDSMKFKNFSEYICNFIIYFGYIYLFILPLRLNIFMSLVTQKKLNKFIFLTTLIIISIISFHYLKTTLEINLSFISNIIDRRFESSLYSLTCFLFAYDLFINRSKILNNKNLVILLNVIIIYFLIISFFTPSQRYLIPILPLFYLFIFNLSNKFFFKFLLFIYIFFNTLLISNQFLVGKISHEFVEKLSKSNLLYNSCPGVIEAHVGYKFTKMNKNCDYTQHIIYGDNLKSIYSYKLNFFFIDKTLSLIKID